MSWIAELRNVSKVFNDITALDSINLKIRDGEILALLGPNGSGKTTLLKILALIEEPTKGEVYFCNEKVGDKNRLNLRMNSTMVFQKTAVFDTTVYSNISYGLRIRGTPGKTVDKEVSEAIKLVRLEGFEKRHAKTLSGGEQQRVALARALALKTKLLLLDEPTANLDPKSASIIEEVISTVNSESETTIIMATHNMFQAKNLPHRVALITNGKIGEVGTTTEIFGKLSKTLASFAALENIFTGDAKITEDGTTIVDIGDGIQIQTTIQSSGRVSIFVSPEDIILSKKHFASSARNVFKGKIVEIHDLGSLIKLKVDVGKPFVVQITKRSFNEMGLNIGTEVLLTYKASSVNLA
jgi:molybdopterin-binding protein